MESTQFMSAVFTRLLQDHGIQISRDGKGCGRDNISVERLWRSLKYEEACLHAYASVSSAMAGIGRYFTLYTAASRIPASPTARATTPTSSRGHSAPQPDPSPRPHSR